MQPLLVLVDSDAPNRFSSYITEILDIEGFCCRDVLDLSVARLDGGSLAGRALVIVANIPLDEAAQRLLAEYVSGGGRLIALRPALDMCAVFGVASRPAIATTAEGYLTIAPEHPVAAAMPVPSLQIHGEADLHEPDTAQVIAFLSAQLESKTHYPAIFVSRCGSGQAAAFAFDLAECVVRLHQGNPLNASTGPSADPDRDQAYRANDLFQHYLEPRLRDVPQADLHQDLLVSLIHHMCADAEPLPRLWHFPNAAPAVALLDGDSDSMPPGALDKLISIVETAGGKYTLYLMREDFPALPAKRVAELLARGHYVGIHPWAGRKPSLEQMRQALRRQVAAFRAEYGFAPMAARGHSVIWVGWTEHAEYLEEVGLRLDTNFMAGPGFQHGYINGSGLPVKFLRADGRLINVFEQTTISGDDTWLDAGEKCLLPAMTIAQAIALSLRQLDDCVDRFHAVYHPYFHPIYMVAGAFRTASWLEAVAQHVRRRGIPFVNAAEWVEFNDARRAVALTPPRWTKDGALSFQVSCPVAASGLTILLPAEFCGREADAQSVTGAVTAQVVNLERRRQLALITDLKAGQQQEVRVHYRDMARGETGA